MSQTCEKFGKRSTQRDNGIGLLSPISALEKDSERARVTPHQFEAKCGFRGLLRTTISCSHRAQNATDPIPDLIIPGSLSTGGALVGKKWDPLGWAGTSGWGH